MFSAVYIRRPPTHTLHSPTQTVGYLKCSLPLSCIMCYPLKSHRNGEDRLERVTEPLSLAVRTAAISRDLLFHFIKSLCFICLIWRGFTFDTASSQCRYVRCLNLALLSELAVVWMSYWFRLDLLTFLSFISIAELLERPLTTL